MIALFHHGHGITVGAAASLGNKKTFPVIWDIACDSMDTGLATGDKICQAVRFWSNFADADIIKIKRNGYIHDIRFFAYFYG